MLRTLFTLAALWAAALSPAASAMEAPAEATLLPGWRMEDGRHAAAIRIRLDPGWKTYWRAPGDGGIPPAFDWQRTGNLAAWSVHWPVPEVFDQNGLRSIGYAGELVLPLILTPERPGAPITARLSLEIGVCETVCIPLALSIPVDLPASGTPDPAIRAALADRPAGRAAAGVTAVTCRAAPIADGMRLAVAIDMPRLGPGETVAIEPGAEGVWVSEPEVARSGGRLTASADLVPPEAGPFLIDRSALRFTVLAAGRAVDILGCTGG